MIGASISGPGGTPISSAVGRLRDAVSAALTTEDLVQMNKMVDIDRADAATVAQEWLTSKGLVS